MSVALWCATLVAAAVLVALAPARPPHRGGRHGAGAGRRRGPAAVIRASGRRAGPGVRPLDLGAVVTEVAARLRMGAPVHEAWSRTLRRAGLDLPDQVQDQDEVVAALAGLARARRSPRGSRASVEAELAAVSAAVRLAERLGCPLADVLDRCAAGVAAAGRAESARRVALAGPVSTARLLSGLPPVGLLLGLVLGTDPVAALLDGGVGSLAGLTGLGLLVLGHRWASLLVSRARAAGTGAGVR